MDTRLGKVNWGPGQPRARTSANNWPQPRKWDRQAAHPTGDAPRPRVFCASLADWLDPEVPIDWLADLLELIRRTPNLDWLLLTKRPEQWKPHIEAIAYALFPNPEDSPASSLAAKWLNGTPPENVWLGTTAEDQARATERIPCLLQIPAKVRFLSCEPLLGHVQLTGLVSGLMLQNGSYAQQTRISDNSPVAPNVHWVIAGGESGPKARPMHPDWARELRDQCHAASVPFLFKQWGEWEVATDENGRRNGYFGHGMPETGEKFTWVGEHGRTANPSASELTNAYAMARVGKKAAGRVIDGRIHNEFPNTSLEVQLEGEIVGNG